MELQQNGNALQRCDSTTGHSVKNVAFCENRDLAAEISAVFNAHDDLVKALKELEEAARCCQSGEWDKDSVDIYRFQARAALAKAGAK